MRRLLHIIAIIPFILSACDNEELPGYIDPENKNANTNCDIYAKRTEVPQLNNEDIFLSRHTSGATGDTVTYCISHNKERRHSRWVAFRFDSSNRDTDWERNSWDALGGEPYRTDPELEDSDVLNNSLIWNNGAQRYQRGHLLASFDRVYSKDANAQTFYFSNISPMLGAFNTSGPWSKLESAINKRKSGWGRNPEFADTLYVVKGGTIAEGYYDTKGRCPTVPKYYFVALLKVKDGIYHAAAFLLEHKGIFKEDEDEYSECALTIDELEEFTGIDFFCNLNDKLENAVERSLNKRAWNM